MNNPIFGFQAAPPVYDNVDEMRAGDLRNSLAPIIRDFKAAHQGLAETADADIPTIQHFQAERTKAFEALDKKRAEIKAECLKVYESMLDEEELTLEKKGPEDDYWNASWYLDKLDKVVTAKNELMERLRENAARKEAGKKRLAMRRKGLG